MKDWYLRSELTSIAQVKSAGTSKPYSACGPARHQHAFKDTIASPALNVTSTIAPGPILRRFEFTFNSLEEMTKSTTISREISRILSQDRDVLNVYIHVSKEAGAANAIASSRNSLQSACSPHSLTPLSSLPCPLPSLPSPLFPTHPSSFLYLHTRRAG